LSALYLETSAVLRWLLDQARAAEVRAAVDAVDVVVTSALTLAESERALVRAETGRLLSARDGQRLRGMLQRAQAGWMRMAVTEEVLSRACSSLPVEPVRTPDAIHLSTALAFTKGMPDLRILSFDQRSLDNALALGIG
jgi:predicted nucleic acid-binding protein